MMTLIKLGASRRYWETHSGVSQIADTMTRDTLAGAVQSINRSLLSESAEVDGPLRPRQIFGQMMLATGQLHPKGDPAVNSQLVKHVRLRNAKM